MSWYNQRQGGSTTTASGASNLFTEKVAPGPVSFIIGEDPALSPKDYLCDLTPSSLQHRASATSTVSTQTSSHLHEHSTSTTPLSGSMLEMSKLIPNNLWDEPEKSRALTPTVSSSLTPSHHHNNSTSFSDAATRPFTPLTNFSTTTGAASGIGSLHHLGHQLPHFKQDPFGTNLGSSSSFLFSPQELPLPLPLPQPIGLSLEQQQMLLQQQFLLQKQLEQQQQLLLSIQLQQVQLLSGMFGVNSAANLAGLATANSGLHLAGQDVSLNFPLTEANLSLLSRPQPVVPATAANVSAHSSEQRHAHLQPQSSVTPLEHKRSPSRDGSQAGSAVSGGAASIDGSATGSGSTGQINTELYKTELCQQFMKKNLCPYGSKCQFAHGEHELKFVKRPSNWKTKDCLNWTKFGECRYGRRCCFKHGEN